MDGLNATPRIIQETQQIYGSVTLSGTTATLGVTSGEAISDQAQVTLSRTSTGIYVLTVTNFRGPNGGLNVLVSPGTTSLSAAWTTKTYTTNTDTVAITISIEDDASTATDASFDFQFTAY